MKRKLIIIIIAAVMILSLSITVIIVSSKNKEPATYSVTVTNGTGGGEYTAGATVKIKANAPETGKEFTSWTIEGVTVDDKTKAEITFTMPANAVTATANYGDKAYLFALENCTADKESAKFGEQVTFTADVVIGKRFDSWNIKGVDDLTGLDLTKSPLTITMPANDINVAAVLEDIDYTVTVTGGTTDKETAHFGDTVTITAAAPATGMHFTGWTLNGVTVEDNTVAELNFTMPAGNVTATANYEYIDYTVTVVYGTAQVNDGGLSPTLVAHYGDTVKIKAFTPETGKRFTGWTITGVDTSELVLTNKELTFTMPAGNVTATAVFEDIDYEVKVICDNTETKIAHYGEKVTITAKNIEGKIFVCWAFTNLDTEGLDLTRAELSFTMPANNVTAKAIYDELITLTFEGTTAKSEALQYKVNDSKSFRLPLGSGQELCTYTIELSNSAFTFKVYGSDGVEIEPYDNGDGFMCIDIAREDNYTIRVINTGAAANCTLTVTQI